MEPFLLSSLSSVDCTVISYYICIALNTATDTIDPRIPTTTQHWALIANFIYVLISFGWTSYRQSDSLSLPSQGSTVHHKVDIMQNFNFLISPAIMKWISFLLEFHLMKLYGSVAVHWARLQTVCASPVVQLSRLCWRVDCLENLPSSGMGKLEIINQ